MIKAMTRRAAFKLSGTSIMAGLLGGASAKTSGLPLLIPRSGEVAGISPASSGGWELFQRIKARVSWENHRTDIHGKGFYDPDIAALRSLSPAMRCWMQRERDDQATTWRDALQKRLVK